VAVGSRRMQSGDAIQVPVGYGQIKEFTENAHRVEYSLKPHFLQTVCTKHTYLISVSTPHRHSFNNVSRSFAEIDTPDTDQRPRNDESIYTINNAIGPPYSCKFSAPFR
jgi:hypothetical protein